MADETETKQETAYLDYAETMLGIVRMLKSNNKEAIAAALKDPGRAGTLADVDAVVYASVRYALWTIRQAYPDRFNDYRERYAAALQITPDVITENLGQAEVEDSPDLPGLLEQEQKQRFPAPPFEYHAKTMLPLTALARNLHRLTLENIDAGAAAEIGIDAGALAEIPIDKRPHKRYIYMLMLNKLAEEYPITAQDKNILIALGNLYGERQEAKRTGLQGGSIITAEDIIRRYRGLDANATIENEAIEAVEARIHILMKLNVSFDFTQHFEYRKKDLGDGEEVELDIPDDMREVDKKTGTIIRFSYHGNMVHANEIEVEYSTGRVARAFEILAPPIVYDYAMKIKQVATIETKLLDLRKKANGSKGADVMKVYLLERILAMIDPKTHQPKPNYSNIIKLDKLFEDLRIDVQNRKTKKVKVDTLKKILDHFKETEDKHRGTFIKGYAEQKGYRGAITGYEILF